MTTQSWIIIGAFVAMVVFTQLGWRKFSARNFIQPFLIVGVVSYLYLRSVPTDSPDVVAMLVCTVIGFLFGLLMVFSIRVRRDANRVIRTWCGPVYLTLWIIALGMRVLLAYMAQDWYPHQFYQFMVSNHLSFTVIAPAFIFMTMGMILIRTLGVILKVRSVRGADVGLQDEEQPRVQESAHS
jgi:hypothetical protein